MEHSFDFSTLKGSFVREQIEGQNSELKSLIKILSKNILFSSKVYSFYVKEKVKSQYKDNSRLTLDLKVRLMKTSLKKLVKKQFEAI